MTDLAIRSVSIAESAQRAARLAADTLEHQPNPFDLQLQPDEHAKFAACYSRWFDHFMSEENEE